MLQLRMSSSVYLDTWTSLSTGHNDAGIAAARLGLNNVSSDSSFAGMPRECPLVFS